MMDLLTLADELEADTGEGPTVGDQLHQSKMGSLFERLVTALEQQKAPTINVPPAQPPEIPPAQVVVQPPAAQPRCSWKFEFERNPDGTIKSITANPC